MITLADGQSITLNGVDAASLTAGDFVFDQTPVTENAGHMVISDGAILPLCGIIDNSGTIELNSTGSGPTSSSSSTASRFRATGRSSCRIAARTLSSARSPTSS